MGYGLVADLILVLHLLFIIFVLLGGLLCLYRAWWAWLHLPAMIWGVWVEWAGWICPLTPLENHFRHRAFEQGYQSGFTEHYLIPLIYPEQLTISLQWFLGGVIVIVNLCIYLCVLRKQLKQQGPVD
jgi:hypothetical protein